MTDGDRTIVPVSDRDQLARELERFAGGAFERRTDGTLVCDFRGRTSFAVSPTGLVTAGMPLHAFEGAADRLVVDHGRGELTVERDDELSYTFRRP